jgi:hypothetical protein
MKPKLLLIPLALCLLGAAAPSYTTQRLVNTNTRFAEAHLSLVEMGGCQYVIGRTNMRTGGVSIVHHAACTNPAHKP